MTAADVDAERADPGHFALLNTRPVVVHAADWELGRTASALWTVLRTLPRRRSHLLVTPMWNVDRQYAETHLCPGVERVRNAFDHVEVTVLATTAADVEMLSDMGVAALHCSQNALVREDLFFPTPGRRPLFDAIYDAKWADYKRHPLAANIDSLALIAYPLAKSCSLEYFQNALSAVAHATWFTKPWVRDPRYLSTREVNNAYGQARVGLCLSAVEGANFASIQYLLAGLPVVTTHNEGGRDEFLSWSVARWVEADPDAVAAAVDQLVKEDLDPREIRQETLRKIDEHRGRLVSWMQTAIADADDAVASTRWSRWPADVPNKGSRYGAPVSDVIDEIRDPERRRPYAPWGNEQPRVLLSDEERARLHEQGFLVVDRPVITADEVAEIRGLLDELDDEIAYDLGDSKVHQGEQQIPEISWPTRQDPRIGATAAYARCQELAIQLLSGMAFSNYDHAIYKPSSDVDTTVGWHQDLVYAPPGVIKREVHIWLALQDVDETNGCMQYVPTPASTGVLPHHPRRDRAHAMVLDQVDRASAVACPVGAGMATVHLPTTPHTTGPNRSGRMRVAWALHFEDGAGPDGEY